MIFKTIFKQIGRYFDIICFTLALVVGDCAAFTFGKGWGLLAVGLTLAIIGWLSEVIAGSKGGD